MDHVPCNACGADGMTPIDLDRQSAERLGLPDSEDARLYTCQVCGDNWLSVRRVEDEGCRITFIHQMGSEPLLKRVAYMSTPALINEQTVERWNYFLGEDEVPEAEWRTRLGRRRRILRSICLN